MKLLSAAQLLDTMGTGAHWEYGVAKDRQPEVLALFDELGMKHCRAPLWLEKGKGLSLRPALEHMRDRGVKFTFLFDHPHWWTTPNTVAAPPGVLMDLAKAKGYVPAAWESINEPDNVGVNPGIPAAVQAAWPTQVRRVLTEAKAARDAKFPGVPLLSSSLTKQASPAAMGDVSSLADTQNWHAYTGNKSPQAAWLKTYHEDWLKPCFPNGAPAQVTETGFDLNARLNAGWPGLTEDAQAAYAVRVLLVNAWYGVKRTILYELVDQGSNRFGLLRNDLSKRPAFHAVRWLVSLLENSTATTPKSSGATTTAPFSLEVDRGDARLLFVWREEPFGAPATPVTVTIPRSVELGTPRPPARAKLPPEVLSFDLGDWPQVVTIH